VLGALTEVPEQSRAEYMLEAIDDAMLVVLIVDVLLLIADRRRRVLRNRWDMFDITVTVVSCLPHIEMLSALRVLRVLRVLRLVSFVPHGRAMVDALGIALRNMAAAFVVLVVFFYSFVIICTNLFRDLDPVHFGTLGTSVTNLYSLMVTFGTQPDVIVPVVAVRPWALLIFIPFVVVASFGMLNLFIGVLTAAVREQLDVDASAAERARLERLETKLDAIAARLDRAGDAQEAAKSSTTLPHQIGST
jgi:voltage-gated sodium channel